MNTSPMGKMPMARSFLSSDEPDDEEQQRHAGADSEQRPEREALVGFDRGDPLIGLVITCVILKITWDSWRTVSTTDPGEMHDV